MCTVTMAFTGQSRNLHIKAGISSMHNLYLAGKPPLLVGDVLVNFEDILPETRPVLSDWPTSCAVQLARVIGTEQG